MLHHLLQDASQTSIMICLTSLFKIGVPLAHMIEHHTSDVRQLLDSSSWRALLGCSHRCELFGPFLIIGLQQLETFHDVIVEEVTTTRVQLHQPCECVVKKTQRVVINIFPHDHRRIGLPHAREELILLERQRILHLLRVNSHTPIHLPRHDGVRTKGRQPRSLSNGYVSLCA